MKMKMSKREQQAFAKAFVTELGGVYPEEKVGRWVAEDFDFTDENDICYREQEILEEAYAFWKSAREFGLSTPNK
tara:strand:+ start:159 stop:383 length:225 start_codon:yes stop_codon:yes gene_type:complete